MNINCLLCKNNFTVFEKEKPKVLKRIIMSFMLGGTIYALIEVVYKKSTHISMFIAGGAALCLINSLCCKHFNKKSLFVKCLMGSCVITAIEYITGIIVNKIMHLNVWDYSHLPFNVNGQICLLFSFLWFLITIPAISVCKIINKRCPDFKKKDFIASLKKHLIK